MSASLTDADTCGVVRSLSVMNDDDVELEVVLELELVAPPPMNCPTEPLMLAIVPAVGGVKTAAARLFCAVCRAVAAPATAAEAPSRSGCVAPAVDDANVACCVCSEACDCATEFCEVWSVAFC